MSRHKDNYEINRGSPSFRLNSIELEIETVIRDLIQNVPMTKKEICGHLSRYSYSTSDVSHVIKHSVGMWCDIDGMVYFREWVYPDTEIDIGV